MGAVRERDDGAARARPTLPGDVRVWRVEGRRVRVLSAGSGEPLVLLPPLGLPLEVYSPVLGPLAERFALIALDAPGFGGSDPLPGHPLDIPALADGVAAALDAAGLERAHLAGNSLGGRLALELARRGRARSVAAFAPVGMTQGWESVYGASTLIAAWTLSRLFGGFVGTLLVRPRGRALVLANVYGRPGELPAAEALRTLSSFAAARGLPRAALLHAGDRAHGLEQIDCPVTIAWGERDAILLPRQARRFVDRIPDARLRWLPAAGHVPMNDAPAECVAVVEEVVARAHARESRLGAAPARR